MGTGSSVQSGEREYLVYWSCRVAADGYARNRLYCNETKDFKTFGPTKMYEEEAFYQKWGQACKCE
ncbi:MAG: hypothetical protein V8S08_10255 [Lachnoclostridium sp.]